MNQQQIWQVTVYTKDGVTKKFKVSAANDLQAREKAVKMYVEREQAFLNDLKEKDTKSGDLVKGKNAYKFTAADISHCETSFFGALDG